MEEGTYTLGWGQQTFLEGKGTSKPWFLNLSFIGILGLDGSLLLGCPGSHRMLSSISGLYPLDAGGTSFPKLQQPKMTPDTARLPPCSEALF